MIYIAYIYHLYIIYVYIYPTILNISIIDQTYFPIEIHTHIYTCKCLLFS